MRGRDPPIQIPRHTQRNFISLLRMRELIAVRRGSEAHFLPVEIAKRRQLRFALVVCVRRRENGAVQDHQAGLHAEGTAILQARNEKGTNLLLLRFSDKKTSFVQRFHYNSNGLSGYSCLVAELTIALESSELAVQHKCSFRIASQRNFSSITPPSILHTLRYFLLQHMILYSVFTTFTPRSHLSLSLSLSAETEAILVCAARRQETSGICLLQERRLLHSSTEKCGVHKN